MTRQPSTIVCIGQGLVGPHADGFSASDTTFSLSGCREPEIEDFVRARHAAADYLIPDGTLCIDKRPAIAKHGAGVVFRAPMLNVRGEYRPFAMPAPGQSIIADAISGDAGNGYGARIAAGRAGAMNFDDVPLAEYARYWRMMGARIGFTRGESVEWEQVPAAPPAAPEPKQGEQLL